VERARTLFFGSGAFAVPVLDAVVRAPELELVAVITAPPRPAGRGGAPRSTPVAARGESLGVPVLAPERLREPALLERLGALRPDVGILADYGKLLPAALLDLPQHGILNLHPSILPRHRGATPIPAAIAAGDEETGVTLFRMDPGMDTGPLVAAERTPLRPDEDAPGLEARLAGIAAGLLAGSIAGYLRGDLRPRPQPAAGASTTRPLAREDGRLDGARPAGELERQVRALLPWPGTFIDLEDGRLAVLAAEVAEARANDVAGTIVADGRGIALATGRGRLRLVVVRPPGGRPMDGAAYRRGRPGVVGARSIGSR
jgi:methionyl-tRNA formyltransferase